MSMMDKEEYKTYYASQSLVYDKRRYGGRYGRIFRDIHEFSMAEILQRLDKDVSILEVACGTGYVTKLIDKLGFKVVAVDNSNEMLTKAKEKVQSEAVTFMIADAERLPFDDEEFDVVISTRFMHLFPPHQQRRLIQEMSRVLRRGGTLILDFDNWYSRILYSPLYLVYNILKYRRLRPDSHYNRVAQVRRLLNGLGFATDTVFGIGGYHLFLIDLVNHRLGRFLGKKVRQGAGRLLSEQMLVVSTKL